MIRGPSQLQLPERRSFSFHGWFSAQELASLSGNLPASLLANCSLRAKPPLQPAAQVASASLPLRQAGVLCRWGRSPGHEGAEPQLPGSFLAPLLFLSPFLPSPRRKLSLTLSRDVRGTAGASGRRQQPQASGLVAAKPAARRWGGRLQERGAARSFLPVQTRPSAPRRSGGPSRAGPLHPRSVS